MAQELDTSGVSGRGGLTLAFFVVLAAGLFFIPEMLSLRKSLSGKGDQTAEAPVEEDEEALRANRRGDGATPAERLERVLASIEQDDGAIIPVWEEADIESLPEEKRKIAEQFRTQEVSWRLMKTKPVRGLVSGAQKEISALFKSLDPVRYPQSRFSLVNYSNALTAFLRGDAKQVPADEYLRYLTELDVAVSDALIAENVQEPMFRKWRGVSLAPLVSQGTAYMRRKHAPPFVADVILTEVSVRRHPERANQPSLFSIRGRGFVLGAAAVEVDVVRDGRRDSSVKLSPHHERKRFTFSVPNVQGDPVISLRIRDEFHRTRSKSYRFIRPAQSFPLGTDSVYQVPGVPRVDNDEAIPKLTDRIFAAAGRGGSFVPVGRGSGTAAVAVAPGERSLGTYSNFREVPDSYTSF